MNNKPNIDIVLPCYLPNHNWFEELIAFDNETKNSWNTNYIVVNDGGSENEIRDAISKIKEQGILVRLISYTPNMGKGHALRKGVASSQSNLIIYTDIDFPFTNNSTIEVIKKLAHENLDVVVGYRDEEYYQKKMPGFRRMLSKAFRFFLRNILKMKITDTQCGLKGFNKKGKEVFLSTGINRYLFDFEFIYKVTKSKDMSIGAVNVQLKENRVFSKMKFKILLQEMSNLISVLLAR